MCFFGIGFLTHLLCNHSVAAAFTEASHQVHSTINDSPSQIATEGHKKHGPDLSMVRCYDADCARDG
jgi:hypothetical protein